jgi:hypothetical protein
VELVEEEGFSLDQLNNMLEQEKGGSTRAKRQRTG